MRNYIAGGWLAPGADEFHRRGGDVGEIKRDLHVSNGVGVILCVVKIGSSYLVRKEAIGTDAAGGGDLHRGPTHTRVKAGRKILQDTNIATFLRAEIDVGDTPRRIAAVEHAILGPARVPENEADLLKECRPGTDPHPQTRAGVPVHTPVPLLADNDGFARLLPGIRLLLHAQVGLELALGFIPMRRVDVNGRQMRFLPAGTKRL